MLPRANLSWVMDNLSAVTNSLRTIVEKIPDKPHKRWIGRTCLMNGPGHGYVVKVLDLDNAGITAVLLLDVQAFNGLPGATLTSQEGEGLCWFFPCTKDSYMRDLTESEQFIYLPAIEKRKTTADQA